MEASSEADVPRRRRRRSHRLAEDVLLMEVLTWLPAKSLCRFKVANRLWRDVIATDRYFTLQQSRRQTCISSGVVYMCPIRGSLAFYPTCEGSVGIPDPFLGFPDIRNAEIAACVHGLLLLRVHRVSVRFLYICNPFTGDGMCIHGGTHRGQSSFGLAFNPWTSPDRYTVVKAQCSHRYEYDFEVFSSSTGLWTASSAKPVEVDSELMPSNVVFSEGVTYWHSRNSVLSYDTLDDAAQVMTLPPQLSRNCTDEIGVRGKNLTCTRLTDGMVQLWVMRKKKTEWEMMHCMQLDQINQLCAIRYKMICWKWRVLIPYDGGNNIYLSMQMRGKEVIMKWDVETDQTAFAEIEMLWSRRPQAFSYHNSLVALPHFPQL